MSIREMPADLECTMMLSSVPKTGEPYRGSWQIDLPDAIEHWGLEYRPLSPLKAEVKATFTGERILARVSVKCGFAIPCSRCLAETRVEIFGELSYLFSLRSPLKEHDPDEDGEVNDEDGDVDVILVDTFQGEISFADQIWEVLLLNLPEGALCRPDCKGLCSICGHDLNTGDCGCREDKTDPRLAVLKDLMEQ